MEINEIYVSLNKFSNAMQNELVQFMAAAATATATHR